MNIYDISCYKYARAFCRREIRFMTSSPTCERPDPRGCICKRAICIWYFRSPVDDYRGHQPRKRVTRAYGGPSLLFFIRFPDRSLGIELSRRSPERWRDREGRRAGRRDLKRRLYWGFQVAWLILGLWWKPRRRKSLWYKLCNYGGGSSVAADLRIGRGGSFSLSDLGIYKTHSVHTVCSTR